MVLCFRTRSSPKDFPRVIIPIYSLFFVFFCKISRAGVLRKGHTRKNELCENYETRQRIRQPFKGDPSTWKCLFLCYRIDWMVLKIPSNHANKTPKRGFFTAAVDPVVTPCSLGWSTCCYFDCFENCIKLFVVAIRCYSSVSKRNDTCRFDPGIRIWFALIIMHLLPSAHDRRAFE